MTCHNDLYVADKHKNMAQVQSVNFNGQASIKGSVNYQGCFKCVISTTLANKLMNCKKTVKPLMYIKNNVFFFINVIYIQEII